jgi:hypothetical protein
MNNKLQGMRYIETANRKGAETSMRKISGLKKLILGSLSSLVIAGCTPAGRQLINRAGENFIQSGISSAGWKLGEDFVGGSGQGNSQGNGYYPEQRIPENVYLRDGKWYPAPGYAWFTTSKDDLIVIKTQDEKYICTFPK